MVKDSASEKWDYREHTKVKHELLAKYLEAWFKVHGAVHLQEICYVDGFAGRGEYEDGTLGSPIIILKVADKLAKYFTKIRFEFVERDSNNFQNLEAVVEREKANLVNLKKMDISTRKGEFSETVLEICQDLKKRGSIIPAFFFVDPFGYSQVPFRVVAKILSLPKTEIFFTFMVERIPRLLTKDSRLLSTLSELFGTTAWEELAQSRNTEQSLLEFYRKQLHDSTNVRFSFAFKNLESKRRRILCYLVHACNNFLAHRIMKDIMFKMSPDGSFAYLGPDDVAERHQVRLFDIHDVGQLEEFLLSRFSGKTLTYDKIQEEACFPWYFEPPYANKHYRDVLKKLLEEGKIAVERVSSKKSGLKEKDKITFPKSNHMQLHLSETETVPSAGISRKVQVHYKEYQLLDGAQRDLVWKVNDGSIIVRFDKTPVPVAKTDVVCPHFLELKWAYGCPFDCSWCYLKGTFRFQSTKTAPIIKPFDKTELHVLSFLEQVKTPEILNTGEIADSLMSESSDAPFSKFVIPLFEKQNLHKVLFLTKSDKVRNLLELETHRQVIISFTLNALPVAEAWEKAPSVLKRIGAAKELSDAGYEVRIRIDPMVPIKNWQTYYLELLELIFRHMTPERMTLGSLRGLQSTVNGCTDKTWLSYLKEPSNWGKRIDFETRREMYQLLIHELVSSYKFRRISLCKETVQMWEALNGNYKKIMCNCVW